MINYNRLSFHFSSQVKSHGLFLFLSLSFSLSLSFDLIHTDTLINTAVSQMYNDYRNGMAINMYTIVLAFFLSSFVFFSSSFHTLAISLFAHFACSSIPVLISNSFLLPFVVFLFFTAISFAR